MLNQAFFYIIAAFTLIMAVMAVTGKKIFRSAIWLLFTLVGVAALYFWMEVTFIAAVQIVVYAGGIVVLIIFSIFLTDKTGAAMPTAGLVRKFFALIAAATGLVFIGYLINTAIIPLSTTPFNNEVSAIGNSMLTIEEYALPFEVVSILLLAAMVGAIVVAMHTNKPVSVNKQTPPPLPAEKSAPVPELIA